MFAELRPRFPLYGGWKTEFTFGYSLPLSSILTKGKGSNQLEASFTSPFDRVVVDDLTVKVRMSKLPVPKGKSGHVTSNKWSVCDIHTFRLCIDAVNACCHSLCLTMYNIIHCWQQRCSGCDRQCCAMPHILVMLSMCCHSWCLTTCNAVSLLATALQWL